MTTTGLASTGEIRVTFVIDDPRSVSVVGDFNGWDPERNPIVEDLHGRHSVTASAQIDSSHDEFSVDWGQPMEREAATGRGPASRTDLTLVAAAKVSYLVRLPIGARRATGQRILPLHHPNKEPLRTLRVDTR